MIHVILCYATTVYDIIPSLPSYHTKLNCVDVNVTFKKYKTFSVLIYSYINTSGNRKNEKLCGNTTPAGRSVFTQFRVFPIFTSVDITVYQYGKNVLYFFYNIAQRTLTEKWREIFRVDIELYQHGSYSHSAFRIYKCYIIIIYNINVLYNIKRNRIQTIKTSCNSKYEFLYGFCFFLYFLKLSDGRGFCAIQY